MSGDLCSAIGETAANKEEIIRKLTEFAATDTLIFWGEKPELAAAQKKLWLPYINWFFHTTSIAFTPTDKLDILPQNLSAAAKISPYFTKLADGELACAYLSALELRSVILGLAVAKQYTSLEAIINAAFLEEKFQEQNWGENAALHICIDDITKKLTAYQQLLA